jgi:hypothetical protein
MSERGVWNKIIAEAQIVVCAKTMIKMMWITFVYEQGLVNKESVYEIKTLSSKL